LSVATAYNTYLLITLNDQVQVYPVCGMFSTVDSSNKCQPNKEGSYSIGKLFEGKTKVYKCSDEIDESKYEAK